MGISSISGHFWPKIGLRLGLGVENFSKIEVKVRVAKLKKIVVDVGVGVAISKKNWAMVGDVFGYKIVVLLWLYRS